MMHDRTDTIDADPSIGGFAIPQPPVQAVNFRDDQPLRSGPTRVIAREAVGNLLQVLQSHSNMKPIKHWCRGNTGISENASKSSTSVGERGQRSVFGT